MHAMVANVTIGDFSKAEPGLRDRVVPAAQGAPGFVAGYWTRSDDGSNGLAIVIFESEDQARAAAEMVRNAPSPDTVTLDNVEVREVAASA